MTAAFKSVFPMPDFVQPAQGFEDLFCEDQLVLFQQRTKVFMQETFPALASTLTDTQLEELALAVMQRAERWHYVSEREIWHYLLLVVYCGFFFDADPQYADVLLAAEWGQPGSNHKRMDMILDGVDAFYLECEKDFETFGAKLKYIAQFYMKWEYSQPLTEVSRAAMLEKVVQGIFPARWAALSPQAQQSVLSSHLKRADELAFSIKDGIIYALASVFFGWAFEKSPVYPWAHFLADTQLPAAVRTKRFIEAAQTHFNKLMLQ